MELRPGRRFEISSHFMPLPRSSMIRASSSADHLLCFFAGDSDEWGGMLRLPWTPAVPTPAPAPAPAPPPPGGDADTTGIPTPTPTGDDAGAGASPSRAGAVAAEGAYSSGPIAATAVADAVVTTAAAAAAEAVGGTDADRLLCWRWGGDTEEDSFESGALRREAISTVAGGKGVLA